MRIHKSEKGFTLIELLVVIAIIGILSSVVLASMNSARKKARDARRQADLKSLQLALESYYDTASTYPTSTGTVAASLTALTAGGYISVLPTDPAAGQNYYYHQVSGSQYCLGATLEGTVPTPANTCPGTLASSTGTGTNYFVGQ